MYRLLSQCDKRKWAGSLKITSFSGMTSDSLWQSDFENHMETNPLPPSSRKHRITSPIRSLFCPKIRVIIQKPFQVFWGSLQWLHESLLCFPHISRCSCCFWRPRTYCTTRWTERHNHLTALCRPRLGIICNFRWVCRDAKPSSKTLSTTCARFNTDQGQSNKSRVVYLLPSQSNKPAPTSDCLLPPTW